MAGPARKREAVRHVEGVLEVAERRACRTTRQPRSTQRYRGRKRGRAAALAAALRRLSAAHPRAGYRMATALLRRAGMEINAQRVERLWRQKCSAKSIGNGTTTNDPTRRWNTRRP